MRQASRRNYIIYLTALSLLLSVVENSLPRPVPFFRLGFANLPLLWALGHLSFPEYLLLAAGKWLSGSFVSGTLLSPFALMGLGNTFSSALVMYIVHTLSRGRVSRYLTSQLGAMASAFAQLYIASFILTNSIMRLLPLMLIVNELCGLAMAYISYKVDIPGAIVLPEATEDSRRRRLPVILLYAAAIAAVCLADGVGLLAIIFIISILASAVSGRRIYVSMYIVTFLSVVIFNLLVPQGRILFLFVTDGSLRDGVTRGLRLISLTALSQSFAGLGIAAGGYIGSVIGISSAMISTFYESSGNLFERIESTLKAELCTKEGKRESRRILPVSLLLLIIIAAATLQAVLL